MINNIIAAISHKLRQAYGDEYGIYSEDEEQGLPTPCFFIAVLSPSRTQIVGPRYLATHPFDIRYHPTEPGRIGEMENVAANLYEVLEYVTLANGDLLRYSNTHHETKEGVLHFCVNYNMILRIEQGLADEMETLTLKSGV